ncbi:HNH endonuclease [Paenibacillus sp. Z3-2]
MSDQCELCGRKPVNTTIHHLTPKEMGGTFLPTASLCIPCHKQIHSLCSQIVNQKEQLQGNVPAEVNPPSLFTVLK